MFSGIDDLELVECKVGVCADSAFDVAVSIDVSVAVSDAGVDTFAPVDAGDGSSCPGTAGPVAVRIRGAFSNFCVDSTEVTVAQYSAFLAATGGDAGVQRPDCQWNDSLVPNVAGDGDTAVGGVDWCDAYAYCAWAGKRLCGRATGGSLPGSERFDAVQNQLLLACSEEGKRKYPYGNDYVAGSCNIASDAGITSVTRTCTGSGDAGAADTCPFIGGSSQQPSNYDCRVVATATRSFRARDVGFRCCSP